MGAAEVVIPAVSNLSGIINPPGDMHVIRGR
jgi:hypothetical protein